LTCECPLASSEAFPEKQFASILDSAFFDPHTHSSQTFLSAPKHHQSDFEFIEEIFKKILYSREAFFPDRQSSAHLDNLDLGQI